tara:strand:- start:4612 stop:4755 length:144 start_codon:yes stop_codon:yes gene_type:complete
MLYTVAQLVGLALAIASTAWLAGFAVAGVVLGLAIVVVAAGLEAGSK